MNSIPTVTKNLLIINVLCFFGGVVAMKYGIDLNDLLGLHFFMASDFNPAQLITYMFMHGGFQHIFFNMFALWMFGRTLEQVWGPKRFLSYYMVCGIGAGLVQELVQYIQYVTELSQYDSEYGDCRDPDGGVLESDDYSWRFGSDIWHFVGIRYAVPQ